MKLYELTPQQQGQLALAVAEILTRGLTTTAEIDAVSYTLSVVRDNVLLYGLEIKKNISSNTGSKK